MKETDIRKYAKLMKELELTGLEITEENNKVRLERVIQPPAQEAVYSAKESIDTAQTLDGSKDYISVKPLLWVSFMQLLPKMPTSMFLLEIL